MTESPGTVELNVDFAGGTPIYRQIFGQIRCMVAIGVVQPGSELPSMRALALELKVAPNTVAKAYEALETAGVVYKRRGFGTFVSCQGTKIVDSQRRHIIEQRIDALLAEAHELNFTPDALAEMMRHRHTLIASSQVAATAADVLL